MNKISFVKFSPGYNGIKLFFFVADDEAKLARVFAPAKTFQSSLTFPGSTRSLPKKEASEKSSNGFALALPSNYKTQLEQGQTL